MFLLYTWREREPLGLPGSLTASLKSVAWQLPFYVHSSIVPPLRTLIITSPSTNTSGIEISPPCSFFVYHSPDIPATCGGNLPRGLYKNFKKFKKK